MIRKTIYILENLCEYKISTRPNKEKEQFFNMRTVKLSVQGYGPL